ncbi:MAG TPA: hypothetical protein VF507_09740, partial [Pyrinomonadaceae bacterium]
GGHSEPAQPKPSPSKPATPYPDPYPAPAAREVVPAGWKRFSPTAGVFSVLLPGQPEEAVSRTQVFSGTVLTSHAYTASTPGAGYMVAYMTDLPVVAERMPDNFKQQFYDGMWSGMAEGIRKEMEKRGLLFKVQAGPSRRVSVGGVEGRDQFFTIGPLRGRAQMALTGRLAFITFAFWSDDKSTAERIAFFGSFRIRPATP